MYGVTVSGGSVLHSVSGDLATLANEDAWRPVVTYCGRTVTPLNYFADLDDYRASYNVNGTACAQCVSAACVSPAVVDAIAEAARMVPVVFAKRDKFLVAEGTLLTQFSDVADAAEYVHETRGFTRVHVELGIPWPARS